MKVQWLLSISTATVVCLGTLLLGMGQRDMALPLLMLLVAPASVWLTDVTGWFRLNRVVTRAAALVAVVLSIWELVRNWGAMGVGVHAILGIANVLAYLQIVLLFQEKELRIYQNLLVLSLIQVLVAAWCHQGVTFGALLVVYLLAGVASLGLQLICYEPHRHRKAEPTPPVKTSAEGRWPLAGCKPTFDGSPDAVGGDQGLGREYWIRLGRLALGTLMVTGLVFLVIPRLGRGAWRGMTTSPRQSVGFNDEVELGELGWIIENPQEVMRLELTDYATGDQYHVMGDIYLRGAVLTRYSQDAKGRWQCRGAGKGFARRRLAPAEPPLPDGLILQTITIEPMNRDELFCVWPFVCVKDVRGLARDHHRDRLLRNNYLTPQRFRFELGTTAFVGGRQAHLVPAQDEVDVGPLLEMPSQGLPELRALSRSWADGSEIDPSNRRELVKHLEARFRNSDRFRYSLQRQSEDRSIDPIEDFVKNNPSGHCEYFATALVLMLREQGIPARMVIGYRCDEYNSLGHFYQVRQLHAHAWVEAYLAPEYLPDEMTGDEDHRDWSAGAWLRLDPTPASDEPRAPDSMADKAGRWVDWLDSTWSDYVMEMDRPRQWEAVYEPTVRWLEETGRRLQDPQWWRAQVARIANALGLGRQAPGGRARLYWTVGLATGLALGVLLLARRRLRRWLAALWARVARRTAVAGVDGLAGIESYRRWEAIAGRLGLARAVSQTHREFAVIAGTKIAKSTGNPQLAFAPVTITEAFYQVRFGGSALDSPQSEAVERALERLEQAVAEGRLPTRGSRR